MVDSAELAAHLVARAGAQFADTVGPGGPLNQINQAFGTLLDAETSEHLVYGLPDCATQDGSKSRNGVRYKTVLTEISRHTSTSGDTTADGSTRSRACGTGGGTGSSGSCCACLDRF